MWKCPVCSNEMNKERLCKSCGFDSSKDFIQYRTLFVVPEEDVSKYMESLTNIRKIEYDDGSWYEGECKNGKPHGKGTYVYSNGDRYVGEFQEGLRHGNCVYYCWSGEIYEGPLRGAVTEGD